MNETIELEPRLKAILTILARNVQLSREQIGEKIASLYPTSKATLSRDLSELVAKGMLQALEKGPSRVYKIVSEHSLLIPIDLDQYFSLELDQRNLAQTSFSLDIFEKLPRIISSDEKRELDSLFRPFGEPANKGDLTIWYRELERFMIELSWKSSKIEGNTYSLLETETLLKQSQEASGKTKHEAVMILNHKDAFNTIVQNKKEFKRLTFNTVLELHNILTKGLSITGGIRKHAVGITGTSYIPLDNEWQTKEALERLISLVNTIDYPLEKALVMVSMLSYIQPFTDGNKRTARMLANAILIAYNHFPLSYRSVDENEYKKDLILFYETNNLYHFKRLFLDQYRFALKTYFL